MQDDVLKKFCGNLKQINYFFLQTHTAFVKTQGQQSAMAVLSFRALEAVEAMRDEMAGQVADSILKNSDG